MPTFKQRESTDYLVIHCSATPPSLDIGAAEIRKWHKTKGWLDIGYHFVIRRNGLLESGRDSSVYGAHVEGFNNCSLGICLVGGVNEAAPLNPKKSAADNRKDALASHAEDNFTDAQFHTLWDLLKNLQALYPNAQILGHRDFPNVAKDCPSFDVRQWITVFSSLTQ